MSPVLVAIGGGHSLAPAPAASWLRAVAAGCPVAITSSYRDPVEQQRLRTLYLAGQYPNFVADVAKSEHVTGAALVLQDPAIAWMHAHPDYGWSFTDPTERWHVAYRLALDRRTAAPAAPAPLTPTQKEKDAMLLMVSNTQSSMTAVIFGDGSWAQVETQTAAQSLAKTGLAAASLDATTFGRFCPADRRRAA